MVLNKSKLQIESNDSDTDDAVEEGDVDLMWFGVGCVGNRNHSASKVETISGVIL